MSSELDEGTYQAVQAEHANLAEFAHEVLGLKAQLSPLERAAFAIRLFPRLAVRPYVYQGRRMRGLNFGLDDGHLLLVRDADHVCLEVQDAGR